MLFFVSWKDIGRSVAVNLPKNESISAVSVLFMLPVRPTSANMNFGSYDACRRNSFSGERKTSANKG